MGDASLVPQMLYNKNAKHATSGCMYVQEHDLSVIEWLSQYAPFTHKGRR